MASTISIHTLHLYLLLCVTFIVNKFELQKIQCVLSVALNLVKKIHVMFVLPVFTLGGVGALGSRDLWREG